MATIAEITNIVNKAKAGQYVSIRVGDNDTYVVSLDATKFGAIKAENWTEGWEPGGSSSEEQTPEPTPTTGGKWTYNFGGDDDIVCEFDGDYEQYVSFKGYSNSGDEYEVIFEKVGGEDRDPLEQVGWYYKLGNSSPTYWGSDDPNATILEAPPASWSAE